MGRGSLRGVGCRSLGLGRIGLGWWRGSCGAGLEGREGYDTIGVVRSGRVEDREDDRGRYRSGRVERDQLSIDHVGPSRDGCNHNNDDDDLFRRPDPDLLFRKPLDPPQISHIKSNPFDPLFPPLLDELVQPLLSTTDHDQFGGRTFEEDLFGQGVPDAGGRADEEDLGVVEFGHLFAFAVGGWRLAACKDLGLCELGDVMRDVEWSRKVGLDGLHSYNLKLYRSASLPLSIFTTTHSSAATETSTPMILCKRHQIEIYVR